MANQRTEVERAILILQIYLSFLESKNDYLNDEDAELVKVLKDHSVIKTAIKKSPDDLDYLPL